MLDKQVLENLATMVGDHFSTVLDAQILDCENLAKRLKEAIDSAEFSQIADAAHTIKGSFANVGATKLVSLSRFMEGAAKLEDQREVDRISASIFKEISVVEGELRDYIV